MKIVLLLLFFVGCAKSLKSGRYVQVIMSTSSKGLAKHFGVKESEITALNNKKKFRKGDWVFIPYSAGFLDGVDFKSEKFDRRYLYTGRFMWPVPASAKISSLYGMRRGRHHDGIDIPAPHGTHIMAADKGVVTFSGRMRGYGRTVILKHKGGIFTVYAHNRKNLVSKGTKVHKGEVIGQVGASGRSTGPHLHFEIRANEKPLDPMKYVNKSRKALLAKNR